MLVAERQRIAAPCDIAVGLEPPDQRLAAARIAADRMADIDPVGGEQSTPDERCDERDETGRITAGVGDARSPGACVVPAALGNEIGSETGRERWGPYL